jgi:cyclic pyranopterin phosphate synthase
MKPALVDRFGRPLRDLRVSVIDKCNFRCPYCMPAEIFGADYNFLGKQQLLSNDELFRLIRLFAELGITKLRLTGGEPLLRPDLPALIRQFTTLRTIEDIALTTNGYYLRRHAQALHDAGLQRLTVSLDSLDDTVFRSLNGQKSGVNRVLDGIAAAEEAGFEALKINCVVKKGVNDHTLVDLARHFKGSGHIVRFIEYMDVGNLNGWRLDDVVTADAILHRLGQEMPLRPAAPNYRGEVARRYLYEDGEGEIGIIASVTQPFCGDCTRARISAAGEYFTCLFAGHGTDLRAPLRQGATDEELRAQIGGVWERRVDQYSELRASFTVLPPKGAEMYRLGG